MGTGQSLKVCVEMLLCKTDSHSGTPGPSPVLCNLGNSDSWCAYVNNSTVVRTSYSTSDVPRKSIPSCQTSKTENVDSYGGAGDCYED